MKIDRKIEITVSTQYNNMYLYRVSEVYAIIQFLNSEKSSVFSRAQFDKYVIKLLYSYEKSNRYEIRTKGNLLLLI